MLGPRTRRSWPSEVELEARLAEQATRFERADAERAELVSRLEEVEAGRAEEDSQLAKLEQEVKEKSAALEENGARTKRIARAFGAGECRPRQGRGSSARA